MKIQTERTFRELLDTFNDDDVLMKARVLTNCLYDNTGDKPSTKDILDAVKKIGTEAEKKRGELSSPGASAISNAMTNLITAYLENKQIIPEQSFNPFEALLNPIEAANSFLKDTERSFLGLSQESKFVTNVINEIIRPLDNTWDINMTKKGILKAYFENNDVSYDEFKNLLKINKIDDPQSKVEMLVSFLKKSNLDESIIVKNVNDFSHENSLTQENKGKILEGYLVGKNREVTKEEVSGLAEKIKLKIYSQQIFDEASMHKANFQTAKNTQISQQSQTISDDLAKFKYSREDAKLSRSIEEVVKAVNSKIRPRTDVAAAVLSTPEATAKVSNDASAGR